MSTDDVSLGDFGGREGENLSVYHKRVCTDRLMVRKNLGRRCDRLKSAAWQSVNGVCVSPHKTGMINNSRSGIDRRAFHLSLVVLVIVLITSTYAFES